MTINSIKVKILLFSLFFAINNISGVFAIYDFSKDPTFSNIISKKNEKMRMIEKLGIKFSKYTYKCDDEVLKKRYEDLSKEKWKVYFKNPEDINKPGVFGIYKDEFKVPDNWKTKFNSRINFPCAFEYNLAHDTYNASLVFSERNCFLAIEAPSSKNIKSFFELVDKYNISHFIKLNPPYEYSEDYYPYWEDRKTESEDCLRFGKSNVNFFKYMWPHKKESDPQIICKLINKISKSQDEGKIIAVSCRGGAGRTATFIAAYMLIEEVRKQISEGVKKENIDVSVDKVVWNVLVQRAFAIAYSSQYINLYRILDEYISTLAS